MKRSLQKHPEYRSLAQLVSRQGEVPSQYLEFVVSLPPKVSSESHRLGLKLNQPRDVQPLMVEEVQDEGRCAEKFKRMCLQTRTMFGRDSLQLHPGDWICIVNRETERNSMLEALRSGGRVIMVCLRFLPSFDGHMSEDDFRIHQGKDLDQFRQSPERNRTSHPVTVIRNLVNLEECNAEAASAENGIQQQKDAQPLQPEAVPSTPTASGSTWLGQDQSSCKQGPSVSPTSRSREMQIWVQSDDDNFTVSVDLDATVEMLRDAIDEKLMPTLGRNGAYRVAHQGVNLLDPTRRLRELGISDEAQVHLVQEPPPFTEDRRVAEDFDATEEVEQGYLIVKAGDFVRIRPDTQVPEDPSTSRRCPYVFGYPGDGPKNDDTGGWIPMEVLVP